MQTLLTDLEGLVSRIPDGALLALAPDYSGCAMAAVHRLARRPARRLRLLGCPQLGLQAEWLIGAGCVAAIESAALTLGEAGPAPRFRAAVAGGELELRDSTCPAIHAALAAAERAVPFAVLRGLIGSDLVAVREDWQVIDNPFPPHDPIVAVPALAPDVALFHAALADRHGNVWIGVRRELLLAAHAAGRTLVTCEALHEGDLLADERLAPGTIPSLYIEALALCPGGAWPVGLAGRYPPEGDEIARYCAEAATAEGFRGYLEGCARRAPWGWAR